MSSYSNPYEIKQPENKQFSFPRKGSSVDLIFGIESTVPHSATTLCAKENVNIATAQKRTERKKGKDGVGQGKPYLAGATCISILEALYTRHSYFN